jgi:hypothetical protein
VNRKLRNENNDSSATHDANSSSAFCGGEYVDDVSRCDDSLRTASEVGIEIFELQSSAIGEGGQFPK